MSEEGIKKAEGMLTDQTKRARAKRRDLAHVEGVKEGRAIAFIRNEKVSVANAKFKGYSPVLASENPKLQIPAADKQPDGTFILGDTIAMEIPAKLKQLHHEEAVARGDQKLRAIREQFREDGRKLGVKTFEEGPNEMADAAEMKRYSEAGRKLFAMGATFDEQGNIVKDGQVVAKST